MGKRFIVLITASAMLLSFAGCRISPALIDTVYSADATEVDPDPTAMQTAESGELDDALQTQEEDEGIESRTDQTTVASQDEEADGETPSRMNDSSLESSDDMENSGDTDENSSQSGFNDTISAADGTEASEDSDGATAGASEGSTGDSTDRQNESGSTASDSDDSQNTNGDTGNTDGSADSSEAPVKDVPKKVVTDASGTEQEIPEDVYTVTAVGAAAPIVAMVGGVGRLTGTSESFVSNEIGSMLIDNHPDEEIYTWWSGDGSEGISDEDFDALLQASPDVCFEISGEATFSSEQITELQEHGIGYLVLPKLSSSENMKDAVTIVADALETNEDTGESASAIASRYRDWVDECLTDASYMRKKLDYYTIYICEWREDVTFSRRAEPGQFGEDYDYVVDFPTSSGVQNGTGQGVAVASTDIDGQPFFEFWEAAGILEVTQNGGYMTLAHAYGYDKMYIFPYETRFGIPTFSDKSIYYMCDYENYSSDEEAFGRCVEGKPGTIGLAWPDNTHAESYNREKHLGGSDRYHAIVVADVDVKSAISNSEQWKAGFLDGTSVEDIAYDIAGEYDIYVNPTGFGNWAEGSVDSPLESYWVLCKISGAISESRLKDEVGSFYSDFYGIVLSDSQIENIINQ